MDTELERQIDRAAELMRGARTVAITGAGISTDAGIPDYRGSGGGEKPSVTYPMFVSDPVWQRWVWQRNQETWEAMAAIRPTAGHLALARLEEAGLVNGVATQNIDDLHRRAGSRNCFELHGSFARVVCTDCGEVTQRERLAPRLARLNPNVVADPDPAHVAVLAEADRAAAERSRFVLAPCENCGGLLKPAVVFFEEALPSAAMDGAYALARQADVALVVGSSLLVMTGMYVVLEALHNGRGADGAGAKLIVINRGPTQADQMANLKIEADSDKVLTALAEKLL
ncbi:MAG: Sir2 family NAD-dependent protein deacetylase [Varibaculum sp.]|nr:Sir2 family NAD-dependent protein deacetylase [Varibaculum sp.]